MPLYSKSGTEEIKENTNVESLNGQFKWVIKIIKTKNSYDKPWTKDTVPLVKDYIFSTKNNLSKINLKEKFPVPSRILFGQNSCKWEKEKGTKKNSKLIQSNKNVVKERANRTDHRNLEKDKACQMLEAQKLFGKERKKILHHYDFQKNWLIQTNRVITSANSCSWKKPSMSNFPKKK